MGVGVAKNGELETAAAAAAAWAIDSGELVGTPPAPAPAGFVLEAAAAAAACKLAMLLCRNSGTPEKARRFEASLSAAN